ncbi:MAG: hypothetical protein IPJ81_03095 [Chitinophagaceae bacterium]|nr:hypothetical protein [Chitinophagaceae bacterium]
MKNLILGTILLTSIAGCAQIKTATAAATYDAGVRFNSICCGTASPDFLKNFLKSFNYENKVTTLAYKKGGCGREGEFYILFSLNKIPENLMAEFKKQLEGLIPKVNEETRLNKTSKGTVQFLNGVNASQLENCRSELVAWDYTN